MPNCRLSTVVHCISSKLKAIGVIYASHPSLDLEQRNMLKFIVGVDGSRDRRAAHHGRGRRVARHSRGRPVARTTGVDQ